MWLFVNVPPVKPPQEACVTERQRAQWADLGQIVVVMTTACLIVGAVAYAQTNFASEQAAIAQATTNATLQTRLQAIDERVSKVEGKMDYALFAAFGILMTQFVSLALARKK